MQRRGKARPVGVPITGIANQEGFVTTNGLGLRRNVVATATTDSRFLSKADAVILGRTNCSADPVICSPRASSMAPPSIRRTARLPAGACQLLKCDKSCQRKGIDYAENRNQNCRIRNRVPR